MSETETVNNIKFLKRLLPEKEFRAYNHNGRNVKAIVQSLP